MAIFIGTFGFTVYNIVAYVTFQRRFKNWQIFLFYFLSVVVLLSRIVEFIYIQKMYNALTKVEQLYFEMKPLDRPSISLDELIYNIKMLGIFFLLADFSKFALGYVQLASMAELALAI